MSASLGKLVSEGKLSAVRACKQSPEYGFVLLAQHELVNKVSSRIDRNL